MIWRAFNTKCNTYNISRVYVWSIYDLNVNKVFLQTSYMVFYIIILHDLEKKHWLQVSQCRYESQGTSNLTNHL